MKVITVIEQYHIVLAAIAHGPLAEAWDLVEQFEELFLHSHLQLCNELLAQVSAIDPLFRSIQQ